MLPILHAADLHLDSAFSGLTPERAAERRKLQRQLPERIVDLCHKYDCALLLLSGDVFDGVRVCPETIEALQRAFSRCRARIFIAPGNHDPYGAASPWATVQWPGHVHIFSRWEAVELPELGCRVSGSGFTGPTCEAALTPVEPGSLLEIGVYHGDPETRGPYRPLSKEEIAGSGLDYLALGHIHKTALPQKLGRTWYGWPGVTMGRGFDETGVHGVFYVALDRDRCEAELLPLPGPRYVTMTVPADGEIPIPADSETLFCRMTFTGEAEPLDLEALYRKLSPRFLSLELRDETRPRQDLWRSSGDGTLRGLALQALQTQYETADPVQQRTIALAARYVLAALEGREAP